MSDVKVSILVPICNVEAFLPECLDSLVQQTLEDIEIICINDGSKDNSLDIIQKYAKQDKRIVVIDKTNSGYGDSMNLGLEKARGQYIAIVESDDFAELDMMETLYNVAEKHDLQVVKSKFKYYWESDNIKKSTWPQEVIQANIENKVISGEEYPEICLIIPTIWSAMYRRDFLFDNNIRFLPTPGASYQDTSFAFKTSAMAKRFMLIDYYSINYRQTNSNSSIRTVNKEKILAIGKEHSEIRRFIDSKSIGKNFITVANRCLLGGIEWNISRISGDILDDYVNMECNQFPAVFKSKDNIYRFDDLYKGAKLVFYAVYYNIPLLLKLYNLYKTRKIY